MKITLHVVAFAIAITVALVAIGLVTDAWLSARRSSAQLATTLVARNATIAQAAAREEQRNTQLESALAAVASQKTKVQTPAQAALAISSVLPTLPLPIAIHNLPDLNVPTDNATGTAKPSGTSADTPQASSPSQPSVTIPPEDLKPLYDHLLDCQACSIERDATKKNLADEQAKVAAMTSERDAAISAAHGGSFWRRLKQETKWFVIGLAVGTAAATAAHH